MRRRDFIAGLGSAAATWPAVARAQQSAVPVIGFLGVGTLETTGEVLKAVHRGLWETGYVEGRNLAVEYRWAEYRLERLPGMADDDVTDEHLGAPTGMPWQQLSGAQRELDMAGPTDGADRLECVGGIDWPARPPRPGWFP